MSLRLLRRFRQLLQERQIIRWNLALLPIAWACLSLPLLATVSGAVWVWWAVALFSAACCAAWVVALWNTAWGLVDLRRRQLHGPDTSPVDGGLDTADVRHLVVLTAYKEPVELLEATLETLAAQTIAGQMAVTIAFEERTPAVSAKVARLNRLLRGRFAHFLTTIHPYGVPGEIPGKCSNVNYATRTAVAQLGLDRPGNDKHVIVTTCDADNLFHPEHFEELGRDFARTPAAQRNQTVWQAPLFYDWDPDSSSAIARNTGLFRSVFMMGLLIPLHINTMSIQSLSLSLLIRGNYYSPSYQMEDILNVSRWMTQVQRRVRIRRLRIPLLSGPTSGDTLREEAREWYLQARRWTVGAAEVWHHFVKNAQGMPATTSASWSLSFIGYYTVFIAAAPTASALAAAALSLGVTPPGAVGSLIAAAGLFQLGCMLAAHALNLLWVPLVHGAQATSPARRLLDIVTTPLTLLAYSVVSLAALHELVVHGRTICGHEPSRKEALRSASM